MVELEAGLNVIRQSPKMEGVLELIVVRPKVEERRILQQGELTWPMGCWRQLENPAAVPHAG